MSDDVTDEEWRRMRSYADRIVVVVKPTDLPGLQDSAEEWLITASGSGWSPDWLLRHVQLIALSVEQDEQNVAAPHSIDVKEQRHSWGADAAAYEIVMWLATWAASSAAWDMFKLLARNLARQLEHDSPFSGPLTEEEAVERVKWLIGARYDDSYDQLEVTSVEIVESVRASVNLRGQSGWLYEVDLRVESGLVTTGRVKKLRS